MSWRWGIIQSSGGVNFFIGILYDTTNTARFWTGRVNSAGEIFSVGGRRVSTADQGLVTKYNTNGQLLFQRSLAGTSNLGWETVGLDSSNNFYVGGGANAVAKYNSSGAIQFQKSITSIGKPLVAVAPSGDFYIVGTLSNDLFVAKYNSSGVAQWARRLGDAASEQGQAVALDSSENVIVGGRTSTSGNADFFLAKYNSSGTIQWQRRLGASSTDEIFSIAADANQDIVFTGRSNNGTNDDMITAKYNAAGTLQWQRRIASASGNEQGNGIATDSSNNVYAVGYGVGLGIFVKYDSSGTLLFQREFDWRIGPADATWDEMNGIFVDENAAYLFGRVEQNNRGAFIGKLPLDGSATNTYATGAGTSVVYRAGTFTASTSSLSGATTTLTSATVTPADTNTSLTDAATTLLTATKTI